MLVCGAITPSQDKCAVSVTICNFFQRCQRGECKWEDIYGTKLSAAACGQKWWRSGLHLQSGPCGTHTDTTAGHWSTGGPLWVCTHTDEHTLKHTHEAYMWTYEKNKDTKVHFYSCRTGFNLIRPTFVAVCMIKECFHFYSISLLHL